MLAGFWAIGHLPLAQAVSLSYSTPLFVTLAAAAMLNERVRARRWTAVVLGFVGVLVIVRPGTAEFTADAMIAVLAAVMSALVAIQIKQLSQTEPADRIVISESGIFSHDDIGRLKRAGVGTFLVGESLMRQADVTAATRELLTGHAQETAA